MEERVKSKPEVQVSAMIPVCISHFTIYSSLNPAQEYIAQFDVVDTTHPTRWRMLRTLDNGEKQELILRIQGILTLKDLPPIQER